MIQRFLGWVIGLAGLIGLGCSIWLFVAVGLDEADKLASVLSFFLAAVGLVATVYGVVLARRASVGGVTQGVSDSAVGGGVLQVGRVRGKVTLRRTGGSPAVTAPGAVPAPTTVNPPPGQSVSHSRIAGPVDQVHDADELDADR
ncbi:hypothetical protein [Nocardia altamirensis]|uniref:hypothetical protein n=1 Tax=Nocardia altamirensis TaxID=472158 RepID=UPI001C3FE7A9|nr:hypothetical protein [Nocardia altamirensis]